MNMVCIIQARVGSNRLPNKIFLDLEGKPVLARVIERLQRSKFINKIVIASPDKKDDDKIEGFINNNYKDVGVYRGSENDVLDRYYQAAKIYKADVVVRITSDCPLIDPEVADKVIKDFLEKKVDYVSNVLGERTYPRGLDVEVFSFKALKKIWQEAKEPGDREHVTLYLRKHPEFFSASDVRSKENYSRFRLTLDEEKDYKLIKLVYKKLFPKNKNFGLWEVVELFKKEPNLAKINSEIEQKNAKY